MIRYHTSTNSVEAFLASPFLTSLDQYYPDISHWFTNVVVPGLVSNDSVLLLAKEGPQVVGMALGRKGNTPKLRCVRVHPQFQMSGVGIRLIDKMIEELQCETPHCTVSQELLDQYARPFVNRYGFRLDHVAKGMYRPGKLEYEFNK